MVSAVTTSFGRPERSASSVSVRPCLNSAYHRQIALRGKAIPTLHLWKKIYPYEPP